MKHTKTRLGTLHKTYIIDTRILTVSVDISLKLEASIVGSLDIYDILIDAPLMRKIRPY